MRLRALALAATAVVLLPAPSATAAEPVPATTATTVTTGAAAPAERAAVTMRDLPAASEVGRRLTIAGTAKAAKSGPAKIKVQRRYDGGWSTVGTDRSNRKGRYAVKVPLVQGGTTSFRVKRVGGGTTPVDSLAVFAWLDVADQPYVVGSQVIATKTRSVIGGKALPGSLEFWFGDGGMIVKSAGLCTHFETWTGFLDRDREGLGPDDTQALRASAGLPGGEESPTIDVTTPVGPAVRRVLPMAGAAFLYVEVGVQTTSSSQVSAVLGSPRLRCNADELPPMAFEELPTA